jgi:elongation factor 3
MSLLIPPQNVLNLLHESLPTGDKAMEAKDDDEEILSYVAFLAAGLAEANEFDASIWKDVIDPYLQDSVVYDQEISEKFRLAVQNAFTDQDDAESYGDDDQGEEVCNLRFNLAYGGKILLHNTRLHLLRGRR